MGDGRWQSGFQNETTKLQCCEDVKKITGNECGSEQNTDRILNETAGMIFTNISGIDDEIEPDTQYFTLPQVFLVDPHGPLGLCVDLHRICVNPGGINVSLCGICVNPCRIHVSLCGIWPRVCSY
jgi:hypothetical protein